MMNEQPPIRVATKYFDISITNTNATDLLASYSANLSVPIIEHDSTQWDVAIVRARIVNSLIPLALKNWNNTDFSITLSIGVQSTVPNTCFTAFLDPLDITNGSPYIWTYNDWAQAVNAAFTRAHAAMMVHYNDGQWTVNPPPIPEIVYDPISHLFSIINIPIRSSGLPLYMWANRKFDDKFPFQSIGCFPDFPSRVYLPAVLQPINVIPPNEIMLVYEVPVGATSGRMIQDTPSLSLLSSLESIIVRTSLDVVPESVVNNLDGVQSQSQTFSNVLTDFQPQLSNIGRDLRSYDFYANQDSRCYQIRNNEPLNKISIQVFWKSQTQELIPLYIPYESSCNFKLRFRRIYDNRYITTN